MGAGVFSVPNLLGWLRLALIPIFVVLVHHAARAGAGDAMESLRTAALGTLLLSGFTDLLDGFLARRMGLESSFGAVLDAVADKLTQVAGLVVLTWAGPPAFSRVPLWLLGAVLIRDAALAVRWTILRLRKAQDVEHRIHGKAATGLVFLVLVGATAGAPERLVLPAAALAASAALFSAAAYALRGVRTG